MQLDTQFSVFLHGGTHTLAGVCQALGSAKINLRALTMMDSVEHGVLRFVTEDATAARGVLRKLSVQNSETQVLCVPLANKPGAMADLCNRLAASRVQISYAYCTGSQKGGQTVAILKVSDVEKARRALADRRTRGKPERRTLKRVGAIRT